jgi:NDP-sugar pyrophosphorylase family protein
MLAVLLAGGLGTRMRQETDVRPKLMVEVGRRAVAHHVFDYLEGDETVLQDKPLPRLAENRQTAAFPQYGFWQLMDTYRESQC